MKIRFTPPRKLANSGSNFAFTCLLVIGCAQASVAQAPPGIPVMYAWTTPSIAYPTPVHVGNGSYTVQANGNINDGQTLTYLSVTGGIPNYLPGGYIPNSYQYKLSGLSANAWHTFTVVNEAYYPYTGSYSVYWGGGATGTGNPMEFGSTAPGNHPTAAGPYYTP